LSTSKLHICWLLQVLLNFCIFLNMSFVTNTNYESPCCSFFT
jgi:hypothetical protein